MTDKEHLLNNFILQGSIENKKDFILKQFSKESSVLDVGCIGQAIDNKSNSWLHGILCQHSDNVVGVDINEEKIIEVKKAGYNIFHTTELTNAHHFDVIVMGDIIEHVSDVNIFLEFYAKHLKPGGKMVITTPNPFSFRQILNIFFFKRPFINVEHTCYLDPYVMFEVLDRSGLKISDFAWIKEHEAPKTFTSKILTGISRMMYKIRRYYAPNFGIVCMKS
ncbi:class I SAM-dependent methyltransferase [Fulvivirga ligni]|uniref:class I SAM-dependent methyltransferase n=1 Tax=Fulvivirga ligni TaxID=2904246 RepID=UPI001F1AD58E|nr:methyltransferase domain-containing protein [Fulvivirga ligni]UII23669.1 methyltransferase domain-containing protein [Fulvivirga ligni]